MANYKDTPVGETLYPHLNVPDTKYNAKGLFHTELLLSGEPAEKLAQDLEGQSKAYLADFLKKQIEEKKLTPGEAKKWNLYVPFTRLEDADGNPTGVISFDFKQNAVILQKDGTDKKVVIALYDATGKEVHGVSVWSGTTGRIRYAPRGIVLASGKLAGVRLDFSSFQIAKLRTGGAGGGGFGALEGDDNYVADEDGGAPGALPADGDGAAGGDY